MDLLIKAIKERGVVEGDDILKVDSFINHQIDVALLNEIGKEFKARFSDEKVTKILTLEASGIAIAVIAAQYFDVPVVFAKKVESRNLDSAVFESEVYSFTKQKNYKIRVSKKFLHPEDHVLIIDDFLAQGRATLGMMDLVEQAGGNVVGIGIIVEKCFQEGGKILREKNIKLESLAMIDRFENCLPVFR